MSYDVRFMIDTGGKELVSVESFNITRNVGHMFETALGDTRGIRMLNRMMASDAVEYLEYACGIMERNPSDFNAMNPENGWGCSLSAYAFLVKLRYFAVDNPLTLIKVCA